MTVFDLNRRIIYQTDDGGVAIIIPADCGLTIEEIAAKDVPSKMVWHGTSVFDADPETGEAVEQGEWVSTPRPYKIIDASEIPADRSERDAWTVDEADLTDGVGA